MGCPFGCQEAYHKARSAARSAAYYNTAEGKRKKSEHNQRYRNSQKLAKQTATAETEESSEQAGEASSHSSWSTLARQCQCNGRLLYHFCLLIAVLSGGAWQAKAVALELIKEKSQQGLCGESRMDYTVRYLHEHPP